MISKGRWLRRDISKGLRTWKIYLFCIFYITPGKLFDSTETYKNFFLIIYFFKSANVLKSGCFWLVVVFLGISLGAGSFWMNWSFKDYQTISSKKMIGSNPSILGCPRAWWRHGWHSFFLLIGVMNAAEWKITNLITFCISI